MAAASESSGDDIHCVDEVDPGEDEGGARTPRRRFRGARRALLGGPEPPRPAQEDVRAELRDGVIEVADEVVPRRRPLRRIEGENLAEAIDLDHRSARVDAVRIQSPGLREFRGRGGAEVDR